MDKTIKEKRLFRIISVLLALLVPAIACVIYLAVTGHSFSDISLLSSEWDDEILYYKQVECAVNGGIPGGYFGYNESHAAVFSFAAWSPFILLPWILWGAVFGWTMTSPFICNLVIYSICFALYK